MHRWILRVPFLCFLALISACDTPGVDPDLTGVVADASGAPVADAAVGVIYRLDGMELPGDWSQTPTPAKPRTELQFTLPEATAVTVTVMTYDRRPVRTLADGTLPAGQHTVLWDATDDAGVPQPSGMYVVRIEGEGLPLGEELTATNETGEVLDLAVVASEFQVLAVVADGDGFRTAAQVVDWPGGPAGVDLTLTLDD